MESLTLIMVACTLMWYVVDNLKANLWANTPYSRYFTIAAAAISAFALSFGYKLDLIYALGFVAEASVLGHCATALMMMGGSALVSEFVEMFRAKI